MRVRGHEWCEGGRWLGFAGGDPGALSGGAGLFEKLSQQLGQDAVVLAALGRRESAAAGEAEVARLLEAALATTGGALVAAAALAHGLGVGSGTAGEQLTVATGSR